MNKDNLEPDYRPVRPFIQIPEKVMMYILNLTPSSFAKVYLYLYNLSYGIGKNYTVFHTSVREIAKNLNISVGRTHNAISYFKKIKAIEKIESRAVIGTKFKVNVPEFSAKNNWYFTEPEKVRYMMLKEKIVNEDKIITSKIKRYKSIEKSLKLGLFDDEE
ncbi:hypothetical protein OF820_02380 [Oceanotoga sp. DSM 15011]|jgi:hypothetical protein|uniref:Helix-turn-helix protein n=1 Tax=Oceanotoga teriensis TaxID=515440 RepID=A0AA45C5T3_9BACT|nr:MULTISPECIES: hypothetical protein [Oceanotoga]MDN5341509.1 hypothetical protein [Oceanotoga sp.]MDO7977714.1 hypothetical protein [Oceanotoga teriensis]PWJ90034.1 hypothetical protein C7380_11322 [Oceanotoga teriensis]UYP00540.1 hypothetical protein OF820_02380 [Oceanotoga sp. DSM 15011]